jgi:hypothetical protein
MAALSGLSAEEAGGESMHAALCVPWCAAALPPAAFSAAAADEP